MNDVKQFLQFLPRQTTQHLKSIHPFTISVSFIFFFFFFFFTKCDNNRANNDRLLTSMAFRYLAFGEWFRFRTVSCSWFHLIYDTITWVTALIKSCFYTIINRFATSVDKSNPPSNHRQHRISFASLVCLWPPCHPNPDRRRPTGPGQVSIVHLWSQLMLFVSDWAATGLP